MAIEMIMPKVDMDQETGTVIEWLKSEGEQVKEGETILVIETDKIAIDVEAPGTGILGGVSANPGDVIPIGTVIAYILEEGEEAPAPPAAVESAPQASQPEAPQAPAEQAAVDVPATPVAKKMAEEHGVDLSSVSATGKGGKVTKDDVQAAISPAAAPGTGPVIATPAARRTARLSGVDISQVRGTGPGGRIQAGDVVSFKPGLTAPAAPQVMSGEKIPLIGMRRTIAERLTESYQSIPHIQFTASVDMTNFIQARTDYNNLALERGDQKVSVTAMLIKLVAMTLADHRMLNSSLVGEEIVVHEDINIGVAVALDRGLIVPVLKNVEQKGVKEIAAESNDLVDRARNEQLTGADVRGGTFTITNLGPFGVEQFNAIINPPEAAILAIGATTEEVIALGDGVIAIRPIMRFTLSADHRIIDGAVAARFIADLKATLENPILMNY
jgi:pyruvate dehydrogenase E2 component (dihydrolipoamide acetyltransferase)